jgi:hypothetical protein
MILFLYHSLEYCVGIVIYGAVPVQQFYSIRSVTFYAVLYLYNSFAVLGL